MHFFSDQSGQLSLNQSCVTLGKEVIIGSRGAIGNEEAFKLYFVHFPVEELAVIDFCKLLLVIFFSSWLLENTYVR